MDEKSFKTSFEAEIPKATERDVNEKYVRYGDDNLYPQFLYSLFKECSIHQGIINQKVTFINGSDVTMSLQEDNVFVDAEERNEIIEGIIKDKEVLGYSVILFKKNNGQWFISNTNSEKWRFSKKFNKFFYSSDWSSGYQRDGSNDYFEAPYYTNLTPNDDKCVAIISTPTSQYVDFFSETKKISGNIYPLPCYSGSIVSIMAYIEMSLYDYSEAVNGFVSNTLVQLFDGKPISKEGVDESKKKARELENLFQNRKKRGGITFVFQDGREQAWSVDELNRTTNIGKYNDTKTSISKNIMIGHSVQNASLFGLEIEGAMGGTSAEEQLVAFEKFNKTYVLKAQKLIEKEINRAFKKLNKINLDFKFVKFKIDDNDLNEEDDNNIDENRPTLISEDKFLSKLSKIGREKPVNFDTTVIFSKPCDGESTNEFLTSFFETRKTLKFISDDELEFLALVKDGLKFSEIAKKIGSEQALKFYNILIKSGLLTKELKLTEKGIIEVGNENDFEIFYEYREIAGLPPLKTESRPICTAILSMNKLFTREEIDGLGKAFGAENLWRYRGGWYHNPQTKRNVHHCRHEWYQVIVKKQ